jgi:hypothetical protein
MHESLLQLALIEQPNDFFEVVLDALVAHAFANFGHA